MSQPNIICISIDSLRADYTSLFNQGGPETTPVLNSLVSESTIFSRTISPSTWTLPVHTSVFTGLYPPEHGVLNGNDVLGDHPTFPELLAEQGYATEAFYLNSWFDTGGILRGFGISRDDPGGSTKAQLADRLESVSPTLRTVVERGHKLQKRYREWCLSQPSDPKDSGDRRTVNRVQETIETVDDPFCFFVHLNDAHYKYDPPAPHHASFTDRSALGLLYNYEVWQHRVYDNVRNKLAATTGKFTIPKQEVETFKNLYRGTIQFCDSLIGDLITSLKNEGVWDDTILIVFGDHGDGFGDDGIFGHQLSLHDSLIRVPLLIRDPTGSLETGTVSAPTSLVDIYPTVLKLAGVTPPTTKGVDLTGNRRNYAYTYYDISDRDWYQNPPDGIEKDELPPARQYGIWHSPNEKVTYYPDLDKHMAIGDTDDELLERLKAHMASLSSVDTATGEVDDNVSKRLKDMGYLE